MEARAEEAAVAVEVVEARAPAVEGGTQHRSPW